MNDGIKEKDIDEQLYKYLSPDLYCYIHNYIVDLQQENERQMKYIADLLVQITNLQQEYESLKDYYMGMVKIASKRLDRYLDYKSRIDKAIEYIENPRHEMSVLTYQKLLNILQNEKFCF